MSNSESIWDYFGENDPYFAVNTISEMRADGLNEDKIKLFFERGGEYIERVWKEIEEYFIPDFKPQRSLDFGCGVARMTLPIARKSKETIGVDISAGMLKIAQENADLFDIKNVSFIKGDDNISKVTGEFDFIHSFIVFQHINPKIGEEIFKRMVKMLSVGGIGVIQVGYANSTSTPGQKFRTRLYRDLPLAFRFRNLLLRKKNEPLIPMYSYNLNNLFLILQINDCHNCHVRFSEHGVEGVMLFFQKTKAELY